MPLSPALRGESPASRVRIANAWRAPGNAQVGYLDGVATGKAPPQITCVGWPGVLPSPLTISVATPGQLGTARLALDGVGEFTTAPTDATYGRSLSTMAGYGQAPAAGLGNNSLTLFLPAGFYDASNTWTFDFGAGAPPGPLVAVGLAPQDSQAAGLNEPYQLTDSVLFRMHTLGASSGTGVQLPANPWDGMVVAIMDADGNSATANGAIIVSAGGVKIQNPYNLNTTTALVVSIVIPYQTVEWTWDASAGFWRVTRDTASGELPSVPVVAAGGFQVGGRAFLKCATPPGITAVALPVNPTEGMRARIKDTGGNANGNTITVKSAQANVGIQKDTATGITSGPEVVAGSVGLQIVVDFGSLDLTFDATSSHGFTAGVWWVTAEYLPS